MKKSLLSILGVITIVLVATVFLQKDSNETQKIKELRLQHQEFLNNSPFAETKNFSREERKAMGLPPNAYNEQVWELTFDPQTGRPMTERVLETLERLKNERGNYRGVGGDANNPWVERGPNNVGGRTRGLMFDPNDVGAGNGDGTDYNRVFAGGVSGGLWVNNDITDSNSSWALVPGFASSTSVTVIISDPNDSNIFYLGSGESYSSGNAIGNGIWKSTDGGANWTNIFGGYTGNSIVGPDGFAQSVDGVFYINDLVARDVGATTELYAAVASAFFPDGATSTQNQWLGLFNQGLYKSTDNGTSWVKNAIGVNPNDIELDIDNNVWLGTTSSSGIATTGGDIYRSTDGNTFSLMGNIAGATRVELEPDPSNADALWALANIPVGLTNPVDMFSVSYNSGPNNVTITQITTEPADVDIEIPNSDFTRNQAFYDLTIESDASGNLIVGGIDLFRSTDGAATWSQISKWSNNNNLAALPVSLVHADQHATIQRPGFPNEYIFGTDGGVFYCTDITMASTTAVIPSRIKDYNTTQFYYADISTEINGAGDDFIGGTQDNGTPTILDAVAGVNSSFDLTGGDGGYTEIDDAGAYVITAYPGNTHYVLVPPSTFYQITTGNGGSFINQAGLDKNLDILYSNSSTATPTIERTSTFTAAGTVINVSLTDALLDASPTAFKVSPYTTASTTLFVGLKNGKLLRIDAANVGATPTFNNITGPSFVGSISDIELGASEMDIYVTMHNYGVTSIWFSNDAGATWANKEGDLADMPVKCILQNPLLPNEVIVGTEMGVWRTEDFSVASPIWVQSYNGMSDVTVLDLDLRASDNTILATTHGRGFFTSQFTAGTLSTQDNALAKNNISIYPKVSNGQITVASKTNLGKGSLDLYSLSGQRVYSSSLNISSENQINLDLSSGIYIVKILGESFNFTDKIIIK